MEQKSTAGAGAADVQYRVSVTALMRCLYDHTIAGIACGAHGPLARRVITLLNDPSVGFLDQSSVADLTMLAHTDVRAILFGLLRDGFIRLQELPKTIVSNVVSSRCFQLFGRTDDRGYQAAYNMACFVVVRAKERWMVESDKLASLEVSAVSPEDFVPLQYAVRQIGEAYI